MTNEERFEKIDQRLEAIAMNLELSASMAQANETKIKQVLSIVEQNSENIRALARIAEIH